MSDRKLRLGEELISPLHSLYDGLQCVGASLARLEGRIAINRLISRFPSLALAIPHNALQWLPLTFLRALISVPVLPGTGCADYPPSLVKRN
ncbi:hypothetical protein [Xenorhabdus miraniensis]|uniref:Cytochrome P450 n=1 Tax=Xenorhabdus miraniensis TaxID=351674 RepID=A0A2D0JJG2_9GAMM|nr:hypothetical protein [Xenorhabdus miraniensis]PHM45538.1 Cytochrome P450 [Xenorhabdus miraniensis]